MFFEGEVGGLKENNKKKYVGGGEGGDWAETKRG